MNQISGDVELIWISQGLKTMAMGRTFQEIWIIWEGRKKLGINSNYGVKRVRSDLGVNPTEDINTCEDQGDTLVSQSVDNTSSIANSIEKDSGQGGPSQNQCRVEKLFEPATE